MNELVTLVKKLLKRKPINIACTFLDYSIVYKNKDKLYQISVVITNPTGEHHLYLSIPEPYHVYSTEISEKDYMEIKWAIEEWEKVLKNDRFEEFKEFVNEVPEQGMDDLLND